MPLQGRYRAREEDGFALIEVIVSALVAVLTTAAVVALLTASSHTAAEQRHKAQAYSLAQEDQARLRGMRIASLVHGLPAREVAVDGTTYTVTSTATFVNDKTATASCGEGTSSADYVKIGSEVAWPGMRTVKPVAIFSILTPANGSIDPTHGALSILATDASGAPIPGVGLSGQGPGGFKGATDGNGCAVFADLPEGNYTMTTTLGSGYVDKDGGPAELQTVGVVGGSTHTVSLMLDRGGAINASFRFRREGGAQAPAPVAGMVVFNTGMTTPGIFEAKEGRETPIRAAPLFPFASPDAVYAGTCAKQIPEGDPAIASVSVPAAGTAPVTVQVPALYLTVTEEQGEPVPGAKVVATDAECQAAYEYLTDANGRLAEPALPWGTYTVCASKVFTTVTKRRRGRRRWEIIEEHVPHYETRTAEVHSVNGTNFELSLSSGDPEGECE